MMSNSNEYYLVVSNTINNKKEGYQADPFVAQEFSRFSRKEDEVKFDFEKVEEIKNLFADQSLFSLKLNQLNRIGSCRARLVDRDGYGYWADISRDFDGIVIRNADAETEFEIDGEDLLQEMERGCSSLSAYRGPLC